MVQINNKLKQLWTNNQLEFDSTLRFIYQLDKPLASLTTLLDLKEADVARAIQFIKSLICKCLALHLRIRRHQAQLLVLQTKQEKATRLLTQAKKLSLILDHKGIHLQKPDFNQFDKIIHGKNNHQTNIWQESLTKLATMSQKTKTELDKLSNRLHILIAEIKKVTDLLKAPTTSDELRGGIKEAVINPKHNRFSKLMTDPNTQEFYCKTGPLAHIKVSSKTAMGEDTGYEKQLQQENRRLIKQLDDILKES